MIHCTDLIRALELYSRGYGDRGSLARLLELAHRNQEDPRVFAWQRERLGALIAQVEASQADTGLVEDLLPKSHGIHSTGLEHAGDAGVR